MPRPPKLSAEAWDLLTQLPPRPPRRERSLQDNRAGLLAATERFGAVLPVAQVRDAVVPGEVPVSIRTYHPAPGTKLPAVIYAHGGGWALGDLDTHDRLCRAIASMTPCAVIAVNYRRAPEHRYPAALDDLCQVLSYVADHADSFAVDATRLALAGDSAGGQLAAAAALRAREQGPPVRHLVLIMPDVDNHPDRWSTHREFAEDYGMYDDDQIWYYEQYFGPNWLQASGPGVAPIDADLVGLPACTMIIAECDPVRGEDEEFARRLHAAGVPVQVRMFAGMFHPFILFRELAASQEAEAFICQELRTAFG
jgi:acetyl esterase